MTLSELIAKLEEAGKGSRELDQDIFHALDLCPKVSDGTCCDYRAPDYTTSLDAALTLVPDTHVVCGMKNGDMDPKYWDVRRFSCWSVMLAEDRKVVTNPLETLAFPTGKSRTAPLALCIAALKARG